MSQTASGSLILTGPHHILSVDVSSSTIRLSFGDLPVLAPEEVAIAPALVIAEPDSLGTVRVSYNVCVHTILRRLHTEQVQTDYRL